MQRIPARVRSTKIDGHVVYDIDAAWPDGQVTNGVKYTSWLIVRPETDPGKAITLRVWIGGKSEDVAYTWSNNSWGRPIPVNGLVSVITPDDVPLIVFWELAAGKA